MEIESFAEGEFMERNGNRKIKFERFPDLFFLIPTIVIDRSGIAFVWLFWTVVFMWSKEK